MIARACIFCSTQNSRVLLLPPPHFSRLPIQVPESSSSLSIFPSDFQNSSVLIWEKICFPSKASEIADLNVSTISKRLWPALIRRVVIVYAAKIQNRREVWGAPAAGWNVHYRSVSLQLYPIHSRVDVSLSLNVFALSYEKRKREANRKPPLVARRTVRIRIRQARSQRLDARLVIVVVAGRRSPSPSPLVVVWPLADSPAKTRPVRQQTHTHTQTIILYNNSSRQGILLAIYRKDLRQDLLPTPLSFLLFRLSTHFFVLIVLVPWENKIVLSLSLSHSASQKAW